MIIAAAIKFYLPDSEYPIIVTAKRHADIFKKMYDMGIQYDKDTQIQGFFTDNSRFLDRYEAKRYAIECGQITSSKFDELYSEDLW